MLIGPSMLTELGGHVQELVQAWRSGKVTQKNNNQLTVFY